MAMAKRKSDISMLRDMAEFSGADTDGIAERLLAEISKLYDPEAKSRLRNLLHGLDDHAVSELCFGSKKLRGRNRDKRKRA